MVYLESVVHAPSLTPGKCRRPSLSPGDCHAGERVVHMSDKDAACTGETWERYRERLRQILSQGRAQGRLHKSAQRSA